ncbi:MAG: site-specific integrase [Syntrophorhabdaceae bacterium]|nr:site-specific integrase [Syntrophorhabdaceae bacterium]
MTAITNEKKAQRKTGRNTNQNGSVRSINGKLYWDFRYLNERVREKTGQEDTRENLRQARSDLNRIMIKIEDGKFRFADEFPKSPRRERFTLKEREIRGRQKLQPEDVNVGDYIRTWYERLRQSGRVSQRTLYTYKSIVNRYLMPFFGKMTFGDMNASTFEDCVVWSKKRRYAKKEPSNATINKVFIPLKMICKSARIEHRWVNFDPFLDFRKLPEGDKYAKIRPFSLDEQKRLIEAMPDHWRPYFMFAFCSGLRQGEQIGLKPGDIDWKKGLVHVRRAITKDENGNRMEGDTKSNYSNRKIQMHPVMRQALEAQQAIYDRLQGEYFFCGPDGGMVLPQNLRTRVWIPALRAAEVPLREMKQTRHTFASVALGCGENPLWIAKVMGHRNTDMLIRVYAKHVASPTDGTLVNSAFQHSTVNDGNNG